MISKIYSIAWNTFLETIRQPIYGVILLATSFLLVMNLGLAMFTLEDDNKLLYDLGLSTLLLSGLFLSAFSASGVLSREIDTKTVMTVVSKPVGRPVFIIGKYAGVAGALAVAFYLNAIVFFLTIRHEVWERATDPYDQPVMIFGMGAVLLVCLIGGFCNFFYGVPFQSFAVMMALPMMTLAGSLVAFINKDWKIVPVGAEMFNPQLLLAAALVFFAILVLTAVAVAASTRLGQVMTLLICVGVMAMGLTSDYFFGRHGEDNLFAAMMYRIVPNFGFFWVTDALTAEHDISIAYLLTVTSYTGFYILGILLIGIALFQKRELG